MEVVSLFQNIGSGHRWELSSTLPISGKISLYQYAKRGQIQMVLFIPSKMFHIQNIFQERQGNHHRKYYGGIYTVPYSPL